LLIEFGRPVFPIPPLFLPLSSSQFITSTAPFPPPDPLLLEDGLSLSLFFLWERREERSFILSPHVSHVSAPSLHSLLPSPEGVKPPAPSFLQREKRKREQEGGEKQRSGFKESLKKEERSSSLPYKSNRSLFKLPPNSRSDKAAYTSYGGRGAPVGVISLPGGPTKCSTTV